MTNVFKLLLVAVIPGVVLLLYVYYRDKYEKESPLLVWKVFIFGIFSAFVAGEIERLIYAYLHGIENSLIVLFALLFSFVAIAPAEEGVKFLVTYYIAFGNEAFNEPMDGIVYATSASLGFATLENILYVLNSGVETGIFRAFTSVPTHAFLGIIMGSYMGKAKFADKLQKNKFLWLSIFVPLLLHGIFDFVLLSKTILAILIYPIMTYAMLVSLQNINVSLGQSPFRGEKK